MDWNTVARKTLKAGKRSTFNIDALQMKRSQQSKTVVVPKSSSKKLPSKNRHEVLTHLKPGETSISPEELMLRQKKYFKDKIFNLSLN